MKQNKNIGLKIVLGIAIVVFCFVPLIPMSYEVVVEKQVEEEYTTVEPYTVHEEVKEPYTTYYYDYTYHDPEPKWGFTEPGETRPGYWEEELKQTTKYRTVIKDVTKYREVTKTRMVNRPVVETQTKRVSILRYLLR